MLGTLVERYVILLCGLLYFSLLTPFNDKLVVSFGAPSLKRFLSGTAWLSVNQICGRNWHIYFFSEGTLTLLWFSWCISMFFDTKLHLSSFDFTRSGSDDFFVSNFQLLMNRVLINLFCRKNSFSTENHRKTQFVSLLIHFSVDGTARCETIISADHGWNEAFAPS